MLIKRRLVLDGDGTGDEKRLQIFIKQLTKWIYSDDSETTDCDITCNKLLAQLHTLELNRRKFDLINRTDANQKQILNSVQTTFKGRIEQIKTDIDSQQELLKKARVVKQNRLEDDLLMQTIDQHRSRKELNLKIKELKKDIAKLLEERREFSSKLNFKVKQCHVLSTSANVLRSILTEEDHYELSVISNEDKSSTELAVVVIE